MAENIENKTEETKAPAWKNLVFEPDEKGNLKEVASEDVETKKEDKEVSADTEIKAEAEDEVEEHRKPTRNDRLRRQRDEARTRTSQLEAELAELKAARERDSKTVSDTVGSQLNAFENAAKSRLTMAHDAYKLAFTSQDADAAAKANFELQRAMLDLNTVSAQKQQLKIQPAPKTNGNGQTHYQGVHPKAQDWMDTNEDLVKDAESFEIVKAIDRNLQANGHDPTSDDFYEELDKRLMKRGIKKAPEQKLAPTGPTNGSRGGNVSKGRVIATQDDMDTAKRLGVSPQDYLKQKQGTVLDNGYTQVVL